MPGYAVDCMIHGEMATAKLNLSEFAAHGHMWVQFGPNHPEPSQQIANLVEPSTWELFSDSPVPRSRLVAVVGFSDGAGAAPGSFRWSHVHVRRGLHLLQISETWEI